MRSIHIGHVLAPQILASVAAALAVAGPAGASGIAGARPTFEYTTAGTIGDEGINGTPAVRFAGVAAGTTTGPEAFRLGDFVIDALPEGASTTYDRTPFRIELKAFSIDGRVPSPGEGHPTLWGEIRGTITGSDFSSLVVKIRPIAILPEGPYPFYTETVPAGVLLNLADSIASNDWTLPLSPSSSGRSLTTVSGYLAVSSAPEPSSLVTLTIVAAGLGLVRYWRRGR